MHVAEELVGVNYRYHKKYTGFNTYKKKKKIFETYQMYVRDLSMKVETKISERLDKILIKKKAYDKKLFYGTSLILIDINTAYNTMVKDIKGKGNLVFPKKIKI